MTSRCICWGMTLSGQVGARWSAASWKASPEVRSSAETTTKSALSYVIGWSRRRDQNSARILGSGQSRIRWCSRARMPASCTVQKPGMSGHAWTCMVMHVNEAQTWTVGVTGATGYAGGEVCRLLAGHPNLRLVGVHANSSAGRRLGELQPHLLPFADLEVQPSDAASLAGYDVVVLALPHGESAAIAAQLPD